VFDAGAIEARLTVDTSGFDRSMTAAEARVKAFEDARHVVKISAVFDNASTAKARAAFSSLDNVISKDAMNRLRSSPNGSVLGSLNALFSPHPVTGAPSPAQAAQQGLLGKIISAPNNGVARSNSAVATVLGVGNQTQLKTQAAQAGKDAADAANKAAADEARKKGGGWLTGLLGGIGGFIGAHIGASSGGGGSPGGGGGSSSGGGGGSFAGNLGQGIGPNILGANFLSKAGAIGVGGAGLLGGLGPLLAVGGAGIFGTAAIGALGALKSSTGQSVGNLVQLQNTIQQNAPLAVTATQQKALAAQTQGLNQAVAQLSPGLKSVYQAEVLIGNQWQQIGQDLAGNFGKPLTAIANLFVQLTPLIEKTFNAAISVATPFIQGIGDVARSILPVLIQGFQVTAPLIRPILDGLGALVANILPGIITLLKVAGPAIGVFAQVLGSLGKDIGGVFSAFAPVIAQSTVIFKAIFDVLGALLPIIGKLAAIFAQALAPVFVQFAGVIKALLPFLTIIGKVFAALAGAVLADLVAAFGALAQLLTAIAPSLTQFAQVISTVFTVLENSGVFAILGDALEKLVTPLATLINAFLHGLMPILPPVIGFIAKLSGLLVGALVQAIAALLPPLTTLATKVLQSMATLLPVVLPLLLSLAGVFTTAVVTAIGGVATALAAIINAIPQGAVTGIVVGVLALVGALKAMAAVSALSGGLSFLTSLRLIGPVISAVIGSIGSLIAKYAVMTAEMVAGAAVQVAAWVATAAAATAAFIAENVATLGIAALIALLITAIIYLATHWSQVWGEIKRIAVDAWHFLEGVFHNGIVQDILGIETFGLLPLAQHWTTVWGGIKSVTTGVVNFLAAAWTTVSNTIRTVWNAIASFFSSWWAGITASFRSTVSTVESVLSTAWTAISNTVSSAWAGIVSFFAGIPRKIVSALSALAGDMTTIGGQAIAGLFSGITGALRDIGNWVNNNIVQPVIGAVKHFFGIRSPSSVMAGIGSHLVGGLIKGLITSGSGLGSMVSKVFGSMPTALLHLVEKGIVGLAGLPGKALSALKGLGSSALSVIKSAGSAISSAWDALFGGGTPSASGNVVSWITQALKATGSPMSWLAPLEVLVSKESGGNPRAVNPISVLGEHASGLFQTLPSTYAQFATVAGGVFNPVADAVAGIRYLTATYGSPFNIPGLLSGTYRGYATGGIVTEPVLGYGLASGSLYGFGERGPEIVTPLGGSRGGDGASLADVCARLDMLIGTTAAVPAGVGRHVGGAINASASDASFRNRYPLGGA
jgi:phage-related protein